MLPIKNVGIFRKSQHSMLNAFKEHIVELENAGSVFHASLHKSEIELPHGVRFIFRVISNYEDVMKVSGIKFHAIFSDVDCAKAQRFLLTRLRGS